MPSLCLVGGSTQVDSPSFPCPTCRPPCMPRACALSTCNLRSIVAVLSQFVAVLLQCGRVRPRREPCHCSCLQASELPSLISLARPGRCSALCGRASLLEGATPLRRLEAQKAPAHRPPTSLCCLPLGKEWHGRSTNTDGHQVTASEFYHGQTVTGVHARGVHPSCATMRIRALVDRVDCMQLHAVWWGELLLCVSCVFLLSRESRGVLFPGLHTQSMLHFPFALSPLPE